MAIEKLKGTLLYVQVQEPTACYEKEKGKEWKSSIVVDEDTADLWNEIYTKQPAKVVKTSDFEALYKTPPPFPDAKKQYVITLRKNTLLADGKPVPDKYACKVLLKTPEGNEDITQTTLVGNGSKGMISVEHYDAKLGAVARLKNILVTELVEYIKPDNAAGSEFDDDAVSTPAPAPKPAAKPVKTPAKAPPAAPEDDDTPF
jgi:hypothetical protein